MRISSIALLAVAACAGGPRGPKIHDCGDYAVAIRAPLARMAHAADESADGFSGAPDGGGRAANVLAQRLIAERDVLRSFAIDDAAIRRAHQPLVYALTNMTASLRLLAGVLERREEARREEARASLKQANARWGDAVAKLRQVCPIG